MLLMIPLFIFLEFELGITLLVIFVVISDVIFDWTKFMTSQEISEFINQPTPRKVPHKIFCNVTCSRTRMAYYAALFAPLFIMLIGIQQPVLDNITLNLGIGNTMTTQGTMNSITARKSFGIGPAYYNLHITFPDGERNRHVISYVWRRRNIPGWGVIPEIQNNPNFRGQLQLAEPFPVAVEFIPSRHFDHSFSGARAVRTRLPIVNYFVIFMVAFVSLLSIFVVYIGFAEIRRTKRLLKNGIFATGYIRKRERSSFTETFLRMLDPYDQDYVVRFVDEDGDGCEAFIISPLDVRSLLTGDKSRLSFLEGREVDLLYLPDAEAAIVPDLWLDFE